jgi:hypothetical protein
MSAASLDAEEDTRMIASSTDHLHGKQCLNISRKVIEES